jgi:hypothetical protein
MISWGIEDEPVPEQTLTTTDGDGVIIWADARQPPHPTSGWRMACRIVGWLILAGALGIALGAWIVMEGML